MLMNVDIDCTLLLGVVKPDNGIDPVVLNNSCRIV